MKKHYYFKTRNTELKNILSDYLKKKNIHYEFANICQDYIFGIYTDEEEAKNIEVLITIIKSAQERTKQK